MVSDLRKSIEFVKNQLEEKLSNTYKKITATVRQIEEIYDYQTYPDYLKQKLKHSRNMLRRNNLKVDATPKASGQTRENCK